jgi:hypothetical protein
MTSKTRHQRRLTVRPWHRKAPTTARPPAHPVRRVWREVARGEWRWVHVEDPVAKQ